MSWAYLLKGSWAIPSLKKKIIDAKLACLIRDIVLILTSQIRSKFNMNKLEFNQEIQVGRPHEHGAMMKARGSKRSSEVKIPVATRICWNVDVRCPVEIKVLIFSITLSGFMFACHEWRSIGRRAASWMLGPSLHKLWLRPIYLSGELWESRHSTRLVELNLNATRKPSLVKYESFSFILTEDTCH